MFDLENLEKTEHYQVPENYFDELPGRVMQNIKHEQHKRRTIISSAIAAVAVIAIAAGVFFTYNTPTQNADITQTQQLAANVEEEEVLESVATDYYSRSGNVRDNRTLRPGKQPQSDDTETHRVYEGACGTERQGVAELLESV